MPQMAPLYWEILFLMFVISLIMMSVIIYHFPKINKTSSLEDKTNIIQINWKW
uniref:ATP synthase complex subunit 8 n=1 Tax=Stethaulax marmoratus TaxID=2080409 RepID=A0A2P1CLU4_9HEMI|nr:ATP synthase F0 subunit 8 [Stethaulax marmoratus]